VADQALSSVTNFALGVFVARAVAPSAFGAFSLAFASFLIVFSASRALATQPFVVRFSDVSNEEWRRGARLASGSALTIGITAGTMFVAVGLIAAGALGNAFVAFGITMPGVLLQDSWRFIFFARRRGDLAFLNDLTWALVLVLTLGLVLLSHQASILWIVLAWGLAGTAAGVVGMFQAGHILPAPRRIADWLRAQRDLAPRFLIEHMTLSGSTQLALFGIGLVAGFAATGAIRAGQILLGPAYVLFVGLQLVAVPEAVHLLNRSVPRFRLAVGQLSAALLAGVAFLGLLMFFLPTAAGTALLGKTWPLAHRVLIATTVSMAGTAVSTGLLVGLRALAAARYSLRSRVAQSATSVGGAIVGAVSGGAVGAAWGTAIGIWIGVSLWWWYWRRGLREREVIVTGEIQAPRPPDPSMPTAPGAPA